MKRTLRVLSLLMAAVMALGLIPFAAAAETDYITEVAITYDTSVAFPTTRLTGNQVSMLLSRAVTCPTNRNLISGDPWALYVAVPGDSSRWCSLCYKDPGYASAGDPFQGFHPLYDSNDLLTADRDYYFCFNPMRSSKDFDPDNLPAVTVNGQTPEVVRRNGENELMVFVPVSLDEVSPVVFSVGIDPLEAVVQKGTTFQLTAEADVLEGTSDAITWSVIGASAAGTKVSASGLLTVAAGETAETITVRAAASANPFFYADATVHLTDEPPYIGDLVFDNESYSIRLNSRGWVYLTVGGTDLPGVDFSVSGQTSEETTVITSEYFLDKVDRRAGILVNIGLDEQASQITLRATSQADPTKWAEVPIIVEQVEFIHELDITYDASQLPLDTEHTGSEVTLALMSAITCPTSRNLTGSEPWYLYISNSPSGWCALYYKDPGYDPSGVFADFHSLHGSNELLTEDREYYLGLNPSSHALYFDPINIPTVTVNGKPAEVVRRNGKSELVVLFPVSLNGAFEIVTQPVDFEGNLGETYSFTVEATGTDLTYQWQYKSSTTGKWANSGLDSATSATFTGEITEGRMKVPYRCKITNGKGDVLYTDEVRIVAPAVFAITSQPVDFEGAIGETYSFTVEATGTDLTYQWQYKSSTTGKWANSGLASATSATFTGEITEGRTKVPYRCKITDGKGDVLYTDEVRIVAPAVFAITSQPVDFEGAIGETYSFTVEATGTDLTYQWQYKSSTTGKWANSGLASATSATFTGEITEGRTKVPYRCKITDGKGDVLYTDEVRIIAPAVFAITSQPVDFEGAIGETYSFTVEATGTDLTYQWQYKSSTTGKWANSGLASATSATFTGEITEGRTKVPYRCKITNGNGEVLYTNQVRIVVPAVFEITSQPVDFEGAVGETYSFTVEAAGTGLTYQWQYKSSTSGKWLNSGLDSAKSATFTGEITEGRMKVPYRCKITNGNGEVLYTNQVHIVAPVVFAIVSQPVDFTGAVGETYSFTVEATGKGLTYQWQYKSSTSGKWLSSGLDSATSATFTGEITEGRMKVPYRCKITDENGEVLYTNQVRIFPPAL